MRDEQEVARLFADLAPLWQALHRRMSTGRPVLRVKVGPLDIRQQTAFADLFGSSRLPGEYRTVSVADVDAVLSEVVGTDSYTVVEQLVGPVGNRAADRAAEAATRQQLWAWLSAHDVVRRQPVLEEWVTSMRRTGMMAKSIEYTRSELERALRVLRELPGAGVPLPVFAARVLGDPHALDDGTRLQATVVRALATLYDSEPPTDAIQLRALWERAGVADDELSSTVLVAGSPTGSTDGVGPDPAHLREPWTGRGCDAAANPMPAATSRGGWTRVDSREPQHPRDGVGSFRRSLPADHLHERVAEQRLCAVAGTTGRCGLRTSLSRRPRRGGFADCRQHRRQVRCEALANDQR